MAWHEKKKKMRSANKHGLVARSVSRHIVNPRCYMRCGRNSGTQRANAYQHGNGVLDVEARSESGIAKRKARRGGKKRRGRQRRRRQAYIKYEGCAS